MGRSCRQQSRVEEPNTGLVYRFTFVRSVALPIRLWAILKVRCPRCLQGKVFRRLWQMDQYCPVCRLEFEREPGYYLGAMYFSYGLALITGTPTLILLLLLHTSNLLIMLILSLQLTLSTPWLFRYSRLIWLHLDQVVDPR